MNERIGKYIDKILPQVVEWRHQIHRKPELAMEEYETSALVRSVLGNAVIDMRKSLLGTDVIAMPVKNDGPNITLRADMDALPLEEKTSVEYSSVNKNIMHACGHDGHTAMLMGCACVLAEIADELPGSVRCVFQPGEELRAAGRDLVKAGALLAPEPAMVIALHGWPGIPVGSIMSRKGNIFAAADCFKITVKGKGGHGSMPHKTIDPVMTGCHIVNALQSIVAREAPAHETLVVSVCQFNAGNNFNIIPDEAVIGGTVRFYNEELGSRARRRIEEIATEICSAMGAKCEFKYIDSYIPTVNNGDVIELGEKVAKDIFGDDYWLDMQYPSMGGEDFAYYVRDYPGAMFALGVGGNSPGLHNPHYDFNDNALRNGIMFMVMMTLEALALKKR